MTSPSTIPIDAVLPEIVAALARGTRLVLRAAPGAGKTTRVPPALLDAGLAGEILVLEPRRIAARAAAEWIARRRGEAIGETIGYRVRLESRGGPATRVWFVTEGIFGRRLARDPFLEGVGTVVLDEFHERRVAGDVALGVVRELQETVRPDLRLVVMSATLETDALRRFLPDAAVVTCEGRAHPVAVEWARERSDARLAERVTAAVVRTLAAEPTGDVLVFLPGAAEIRRAATALAPIAAARDVEVVLLHGDLALVEQRRAIEPGLRRRVILSTNVAETSLTIEGVRTVVDSGLAREARFDPRHGVNRLRTVRVSRASAEQRAGRAGRLGPGRSIRLWTEAEHRERRERETPEVLRLDLTSTVLELRAWGLRDPAGFAWLDPPPAAAIERAEALLRDLGAVAADGVVTPLGRRLLELAVEPRLARMQIESERRDVAAAGALLAALASEDDVRVGARSLATPAVAVPSASGRSDLLERAELFLEAERSGFERRRLRELGLDPAAVRTVERTRRALLRSSRTKAAPSSLEAVRVLDAPSDDLLRVVLAGFPDRVARRRERGSSRAAIVGGGVVELAAESVVRDAELFVAVELEGRTEGGARRTRVRIASEIRREWLDEDFPAARRREAELVFDPARRRVVERRRELYRDLELETAHAPAADRIAAGALLAEAVLADRERLLPLALEDRRLLERIAFLASVARAGDVPGAAALVEASIRDAAAGRASVDEIHSGDVRRALLQRVPASLRSALDRDAPERLLLPSRRSVAIEYSLGKPPAAAARLQELFGLRATPRLGGGRVPLVLEILAPNGRPVQVTDDLESFWARTYAEVRRELRGRYPKHAWPEDPTSAAPTRAPRRR